MATGNVCVSEWDKERVAEAVAAEFGQDISENFYYKFYVFFLRMVKECSDQGVDRETLQMPAVQGSIEQLRECGLLTIKQQMQLKKFVQSLDPTPTHDPSPSSTTSSHTQLQDRKLTKKELARLPLEEKQTYLIK